jgi:hypothetical protein
MVLAFLASSGPVAFAQSVQTGTNTISGLVRFGNTDPGILTRLGPPGNEGVLAFSILAYAEPAGVPSASKSVYPADPLGGAYALTVAVDNAPLTYTAYAYLVLDVNEEYWTPTQTAAPLTSNSPPATLNFEECVALVELRYVDSAGQPVAALGGRASATETAAPFRLRARYTVQPPGRTNNFFVVPAGAELELVVEVDTGTDIYSDRITHRETHTLTLACEDQPVLTITVPDVGALGSIVGNANLVDEIELPTEGYLELLGRPVIKAAGPAGNQRYGALPAELPGADLSRTFEFENLVSSAPGESWRVQAEMQFGEGYRFEFFQTPALGAGLNAGVEVTAGLTTDLGDTFVMTPARIVGQIRLTGPPESGGNLSALRGLVRAADYDPDTNGIPDGIGPGGIGGSYVNAAGVDELAPGATRATTGSTAAASFAGAFNPATAAFEGDYEVVLGMLDDQPGVWRQDSLTYTFFHSGLSGGPYVNQVGNVTEDLPWQGTLAPGDRATNDLRYGFAEVCLRIRAPVPFYNPLLNASGGLSGLDSWGQPRSYRVGSDYGYGQPDTAATAATEGLVTLYLPEGTFTLQPAITTVDPDGGESFTQLPAMVVTVVEGERYCLEDCIRVFIEPPVCTTNFGFIGWGNAVSSCGETLTNLSVRMSPLSDPSIRLGYSEIWINAGGRETLRMPCQVFPEFDGFDRSLYNDMLFKVVAKDNLGHVATREMIVHYDFTAPTLQCTDLTVTATNGVSAIVNYSVTTADDRPGPVLLHCQPPSGSGFAIGTHTVTCRASDLCHNTNTCTFQVVVLPPECGLRIELTQPAPPEVTLTWDCGSALESAPDLAGPWWGVVGASSPYVTTPIEPRAFYRLKSSAAGTALQFPGTSSASATVTRPFYPYLPFTIAAWVKTSQGTGAYPGIVTKYLGGSGQGFALALNAGRLAPWYYADTTHFVEPGFSGPTDRFIADGLWHHLAFVVDTSSGRTFIDGQLVNTQGWTGTPATSYSTEPLRFGAYPGGAGLPFSGELDEVTLWNRALSESEIGTLSIMPAQGTEAGLQGCWRFDEAGGGTAFDWTGHGYDATPTATVNWTISTAPISP